MHPDRNTWNRQNTVFSIFFFFPFINSLREHPFFSALVSSLFFEVREATTGNTSAVRRLAQFKKLRMCQKENADLRHENIIVMAFLMWIKTNSGCLRLSLSVTSRSKLRGSKSPVLPVKKELKYFFHNGDW